jgi:hypothetical protein
VCAGHQHAGARCSASAVHADMVGLGALVMGRTDGQCNVIGCSAMSLLIRRQCAVGCSRVVWCSSSCAALWAACQQAARCGQLDNAMGVVAMRGCCDRCGARQLCVHGHASVLCLLVMCRGGNAACVCLSFVGMMQLGMFAAFAGFRTMGRGAARYVLGRQGSSAVCAA